MFLREASRLDSLRFRAMLTIWADSKSSWAMLVRGDEPTVMSPARDSRFVTVEEVELSSGCSLAA
jgi:hypothetical protein